MHGTAIWHLYTSRRDRHTAPVVITFLESGPLRSPFPLPGTRLPTCPRGPLPLVAQGPSHLSAQRPLSSCSALSAARAAASRCSRLSLDFFARCRDSGACDRTRQTAGARGMFAGRSNRFYGFHSKTETERHRYLQLRRTPEFGSEHLDAYRTP